MPGGNKLELAEYRKHPFKNHLAGLFANHLIKNTQSMSQSQREILPTLILRSYLETQNNSATTDSLSDKIVTAQYSNAALTTHNKTIESSESQIYKFFCNSNTGHLAASAIWLGTAGLAVLTAPVTVPATSAAAGSAAVIGLTAAGFSFVNTVCDSIASSSSSGISLSETQLKTLMHATTQEVLNNPKFGAVVEDVMSRYQMPISFKQEIKSLVDSSLGEGFSQFKDALIKQLPDILAEQVTDFKSRATELKDALLITVNDTSKIEHADLSTLKQELAQLIEAKKTEDEIKAKRAEYQEKLAEVQNFHAAAQHSLAVLEFIVAKCFKEPEMARDISVGLGSIITIGSTAAMCMLGALPGGPVACVSTIFFQLVNMVKHFVAGDSPSEAEQYFRLLLRELNIIKDYLSTVMPYLVEQNKIIIHALLEIREILETGFKDIKLELQQINEKLSRMEWHLTERADERERKKARDKLDKTFQGLMLLYFSASEPNETSYNKYLLDIYDYRNRAMDNVFSGATEHNLSKQMLIAEIVRRTKLEHSFGLLPQLIRQLNPTFTLENLSNPVEWYIGAQLFLAARKSFSQFKNPHYIAMLEGLIAQGKNIRATEKILKSNQLIQKVIASATKEEQKLCAEIQPWIDRELEILRTSLGVDEKTLLQGYLPAKINYQDVNLPVGWSGNDQNRNINHKVKYLSSANYHFIRMIKSGSLTHFRIYYLGGDTFNPVKEAERIELIEIKEISKSEHPSGHSHGGDLHSVKRCLIKFLKGPLKGFSFIIQKTTYNNNPNIEIYDDIYNYYYKDPAGNIYTNWSAAIENKDFDLSTLFPQPICLISDYLSKTTFFDIIHYQLNNFILSEKQKFVQVKLALLLRSLKSKFTEHKVATLFLNILHTYSLWKLNPIRAESIFSSSSNEIADVEEAWLKMMGAWLADDIYRDAKVEEMDGRLVLKISNPPFANLQKLVETRLADMTKQNSDKWSIDLAVSHSSHGLAFVKDILKELRFYKKQEQQMQQKDLVASHSSLGLDFVKDMMKKLHFYKKQEQQMEQTQVTSWLPKIHLFNTHKRAAFTGMIVGSFWNFLFLLDSFNSGENRLRKFAEKIPATLLISMLSGVGDFGSRLLPHKKFTFFKSPPEQQALTTFFSTAAVTQVFMSLAPFIPEFPLLREIIDYPLNFTVNTGIVTTMTTAGVNFLLPEEEVDNPEVKTFTK